MLLLLLLLESAVTLTILLLLLLFPPLHETEQSPLRQFTLVPQQQSVKNKKGQ